MVNRRDLDLEGGQRHRWTDPSAHRCGLSGYSVAFEIGSRQFQLRDAVCQSDGFRIASV